MDYSTKNRYRFNLIAHFSVVILLLQSCASHEPFTRSGIKTFDPDTSRISQPEEAESYQYWDRINNTVLHQLEKPLDLNRVFRFMGKSIGLASAKQADNINHLDEVPESSWYSYRHYYNPMASEELAKGPNTVEPDTSGSWTIFSAKLEGANPGFFARDSKGNRFLIKFDGPNYPELTTSAEVIGTKIFYAAGYYVPESVITYFNPDKVNIDDGVMVEENGDTRQMTDQDYRQIISVGAKNSNGEIRALASKFVDGIPLGPWYFEGTRKDDPNDRVDHEHRREIRGMRVISSWLNDTDRRDANTMAVYTDHGYIRHLVQDFGNTLGANGASIHQPIYGEAYLIDPRYMALSAISLGFKVHSWENTDAEEFIPHPSVGYFRSDTFQPGKWVSAHPIPAFENMTLRDAFWGAKQVMSFSDEDIRAIVETGQLSHKQAEEYLINILIERRDRIGEYWFSKINPIDKFNVQKKDALITLGFSDPGKESGIFDSETTRYIYTLKDSNNRIIALNKSSTLNSLTDFVSERTPGEQRIFTYSIATQNTGINSSDKKVRVYVIDDDKGVRIGGIQREE